MKKFFQLSICEFNDTKYAILGNQLKFFSDGLVEFFKGRKELGHWDPVAREGVGDVHRGGLSDCWIERCIA